MAEDGVKMRCQNAKLFLRGPLAAEWPCTRGYTCRPVYYASCQAAEAASWKSNSLKQDEEIYLGWFNFSRAASKASRISGRCC